MTYTINNQYPEHEGHPAFTDLPECATISQALEEIGGRAESHKLDISHFRIAEWDVVDGEEEIIRSMCADQYQREMKFPLSDGTEITAMVPSDRFVHPCTCRPLPVGNSVIHRVMVSGEDDCVVHGFKGDTNEGSVA